MPLRLIVESTLLSTEPTSKSKSQVHSALHCTRYGPGLRYEVGICIHTGWIMWFNGPYRLGMYSDLRLACECGLHDCIDHGERYIADGYKMNKAITLDDIANW